MQYSYIGSMYRMGHGGAIGLVLVESPTVVSRSVGLVSKIDEFPALPHLPKLAQTDMNTTKTCDFRRRRFPQDSSATLINM